MTGDRCLALAGQMLGASRAALRRDTSDTQIATAGPRQDLSPPDRQFTRRAEPPRRSAAAVVLSTRGYSPEQSAPFIVKWSARPRGGR